MKLVDKFKKGKTEFEELSKLDQDQAHEEIEALREAIEYHDYLYYVRNRPEISDAKYDRLFKRLEKLEDVFPQFDSPNSPTKRVGAKPVDELEKREHSNPLLSLSSALEKNEVKNYFDFVNKRVDTGFWLEPKFDGFSVEIVYQDGHFKHALTRGDGFTGEDISHNIRTVRSVPMRLHGDAPKFLSVRGEIYLPKDEFTKLNKIRSHQGKELFANPRNAAAGMMRQHDSRKVKGAAFDIVFYDIVDCSQELVSHKQALKMFSKLGLKTNSYNEYVQSFEDIVDYYNWMEDTREDLEYEIDGVVIKTDSYDSREKLGTRERSPRWAFAWKFPPKQEETKITDIIVQVGRTGILTPVALLEPVDVGGVTVSRATLHNEDYVKELQLKKGDTVRIIRAGDVIPEVKEKVKDGKGKIFSMPKQCPSCKSEPFREGAYWICPSGIGCPAQLKGHIQHYASREAINIEGLGEKVAKQLVEREMVKDLAGLYHLDIKDLQKLEGFAEKSAKKLYDAIQSSKEPRLDRFLYALGIRHVGSHMARVLAKEYGALEKLQKADDLQEADEIGPEIAKSVKKFFKEKKNLDVIGRLKKAGLKVKELKVKQQALDGMSFVFTGKLENWSRAEAKRLVEDYGADASSSVSSNTDYVVAGSGGGSKLDEAKKNNVKVIDEEKFLEMLREKGVSS